MKNQFLTVILVVVLAGCSLLPSSFDGIEHSYLINIAELSSDTKVCDDKSRAVYTSQQITTHAQWVYRYGRSMDRNEKMATMEKDLLDMSRELSDRYGNGAVSVVYCRSKLINIHNAANAIISISSRRPRL